MADFSKAFTKTIGHEGGYSNDPTDRGGETYRGISRVRHPNWVGWGVIEECKINYKAPFFNENKAAKNQGLQDLVGCFYKTSFWNQLSGDYIPNQAVAEKLFDIAVNMGIRTAKRFFQESVNLLNRNAKLTPDLQVDGRIGKKTMAGLAALLDKGDEKYILMALGVLQGERYFDICRRDKTQERFIRGWLNRV